MKALQTIIVSALILMSGTSMQTSAQVISTDIYGIQADFNAAQGVTKIIFFGDPTCPGCIASANDLRIYEFNQCNNPDLRGFIVWMHVGGYPSTYSSAVTQSALWSDSRVTFYWDSIGTDMAYNFGYLNTWSDCNYAWDMSMIYSDTATWTATIPNAPLYCMSKTGCCNTYNIINERNQLIALGVCSATGITENSFSNSDFGIFPNPATAEIKINLPSKTNFEFRIFNTLGKAILKIKNQTSINISDLPEGIYFLEATIDGKRITKKFVKL